MKIRQDDIPQLKLLNNELLDLSNIPVKAAKAYNYMISLFNSLYKENVFYIAPAFSDAAHRASEKIMVPNLIDELNDEYGSMFYNGDDKRGSLCMFYYILNKDSYQIITVANMLGKNELVNLEMKNKSSDPISWSIDEQRFPAKSSLLHVMNMLLFKKFADVEIVHTKPDERKHYKGENYKNLTKSDIIFLDSKWFREIIRTEGFGVSGHFRLQPYKDKKELIYINEFKKKGYHRKAKISE